MDTTPQLEPADSISLPSGPSAPRRTVPPSLAARYDDIEFLGEGGMGTVYRGRDPHLGRSVALKLIKGDDPALWQRFLQEAKAQARIQHAYVCRVYEAGQADGEPYIAMQYIDGESLSRLYCRLRLEQNVKLIMDVASAVHEAHRLGLIHRDIKPGNILVETLEDGTLKPYIMDFGLARQVQEKGQTMTGAVVGTPAYMPPEQAIGDIRAMDRRSDVYSLGATLYEAIAGRPPFVAENHWQLLIKVGYEEAPALGKVKKGVPVDLETIVMKCLEREPGRRYDSAKALAEDLQRFLDGDAILAKRSSWGYVLWKKARKHKIAMMAGLLALICAAVPLGAWIQSRRQMAMQVEFARTLGEDVKANELYLRAVYELPLHDVAKEHDVVRRRLADIERNMLSLGKAAEGPGHYAIGRGQLALGDMDQARAHLEQAVAAGYAPPELHYALGRVLGELYRRGLEESKRLSEEQGKIRVAELEKQLRDPALAHLRAAAGRVDSPLYVEGLIAFYEAKYDEALEKAKKAFAEAPLMYEAKKLEADVLFAQGSRYRHDAAFDYDKMMTYFKPAVEAYAAAANIGRSDAEVHRAECELWAQTVMSDIARGRDWRESLTKADSACMRAIEAMPADGRAYTQRAFAHAMLAVFTAQANTTSGNVGLLVTNAIRLAEGAQRQAAENAMAHYVVGLAYTAEVVHQMSLQRDASTLISRGLDAFGQAARLDTSFTWAFQDAANLSMYAIRQVGRQGRNPAPTLALGMKYIRAGLALAPNAPFFMINQGSLYAATARVLVECGQDPREQVALSLEALDAFQRLSPNHWLSHNNVADIHNIAARYESLAGKDAGMSFQRARDAIEQAKKCGGGAGQLADTIGEFHTLQALDAMQHDHDPTESIAMARETYGTVMKATPWSVYYAARQTQVELVALRWAMKQHNATAAMFDAAFAPLAPLFSDEIADPGVYVALAEIHALRAQWLLEAKKDPTNDIQKGMALTGKALAIHPHKGQALAMKAELLLSKAIAAKDPGERKQEASAAQAAFQQAFKEIPLLERTYGPAAQNAANMSR